ncbi:hypothetical protein E8E13_003388 [Curvularia kusanoi]|uniref:BRCT domain-containing protein n=1 Tax=Curvularia kusanoi TaxID=90978 RepID=A0A9P4WBR6_CURKU|nr:hypothetical protein E8E13_003388 [Curvularia kusanoi]
MVATRRGAKAAPEVAPAASTLAAPPKRGRKKAVVEEEVAEPTPVSTRSTKTTTTTRRKAKTEATPEVEAAVEEALIQKKTRATRAAKVETTEDEQPAPVAAKRATRGRKASTPIVEEPVVEEPAEEEEQAMPQPPVKIQVATRARKAPVKKTPAKSTEPVIVEEPIVEAEEVPRTATRTRKTVTIEEPVADEAPKPASRARKAPARKAPAAKAEALPVAENTITAEPIKPASRARKAAAPLDAAPVLAPPSRATRATRNTEIPPASPLKAPARKPTKKATPAKAAKIASEEPTPVEEPIAEDVASATEAVEEPFTEYPAIPSTPAQTTQLFTNKRAMFELPQYPKTPAHIQAPISNKEAMAEMPDYPKTPAHIQAPVAVSPDTDVLMTEMPEEYPKTPAHINAPINHKDAMKELPGYPKTPAHLSVPISSKAALKEMPSYPETPAHIKAPMAAKEALNELPGYPKTPAHIKAPLSSRQALAELPDYPKTPAHIVARPRLSVIEEVSVETSRTPQSTVMPPVGLFAVPRTPAAQCSPAHVAKKEIFTPKGATPAVTLQAPCTPQAQCSPEHVAVKEVFTSPAPADEEVQPNEATSAAVVSPAQAVTPVRSNTPEVVQRTPAVRFMAPTTPRAQCSPEHVAPKETFTPPSAAPAVELKAPCTPPAQTSPEHIANKENFTPHSAAPVTPVRATSANRKALGELPDYPTTPALAMEAAIQEEIRASAKKQTPSPSHFSTHDTSFDEASEVTDLSISELENENTPAEKPQAQFAPLQLKPLTLAPPTSKIPFFAPPTFTPSVFTPRATGSFFSAPPQKSPAKAATFAFSATTSPMKSSLRSPVKSSLRSPEKRRSNESPKKAVTWGDFDEPSILFDGPLQGLTFYVDVISDSGKDQSFLFETLLTDLGAKVLKEWSHTGITHVLYKDGKTDTLKKVVESKGAIKAVNVSWALECEANKKRVDEAKYLVNLSAALPASPKVSMIPCTPAKTPSKYALPPSSGERSQPATPTSSEFDRSINLDDKENSELGIYFEADGKMAVRTLPQKKSNFLLSRSPIKTPSKQRMMTATPMRPFSTTKKRSAEVFAGISMAPPKKLRLF